MVTLSWAASGEDADSHDRPVFLQDWWLDAACCDDRSTVSISTSPAAPAAPAIGWMRYIVYRNKIGLRLGASPFWTHLGGPTLRRGLASDVQRRAVREVVGQLPSNVSMHFVCDANTDYASIVREELVAAGFTLSLLPTYLHRPGDPDILSRMKSRHRAQIRASSNGMIIQDARPDEFINFYRRNLPAPTHSPLSVAHRLLSEGIARGQARALLAVNMRGPRGQGIPDAAIACVWDRHRYYYWLSARRRSLNASELLPNREATKLLVLAAVDHAVKMGLVFDADSPETAGGRAVFTKIFGFRRVEHRLVFTRSTFLTKVYNRVTRRIKEVVKSAYPRARIHVPQISMNAP